MESDAAALWRAILAAPHDDAPRLVYADWLDDHGQPERAEFIRLQCRFPRSGEEPGRAARRREGELWSHHAAAWQAELPAPLRSYPFHRGFVYPHLLHTSPADFLRIGPEQFHAAPLWAVHLRHGTSRALDRVIGAPGLRAVDALELIVAVPAPGLSAFLNDAPLENLRALQVNGVLPDGVPFDEVAPARLPHLRRLGLAWGACRLAGAERLARSNLPTKLEAFGVTSARIGDDGLRTLFAAPRWPALEELRLPDNGLTSAGLSVLLANPSLARLRRLDLGRNLLGDDGARLLALSPALSAVSHLHLDYSNIGPAGARALTSSPFLANLQILSLVGVPAVRDPGMLTRLRRYFGSRLVT